MFTKHSKRVNYIINETNKNIAYAMFMMDLS